MVKLHASYGLKLPGPQEYSSESFHATAEVELADNLVNQPEALKAALHSLWDDLKQAVAEEIQRKPGAGGNGTNSQPAPVNRVASRPMGYGTGATGAVNNVHREAAHHGSNGNGRRQEPAHRGNGQPAPASKKQVGFLLSLARRKLNFSAEQTRHWLQAERGLQLNALSKTQAGALIDELNTDRA